MTAPRQQHCSDAPADQGGPAAEALDEDPGVLMQRVALGDAEAFGRLYDLVAKPVFGLVCRVLRDRAQAEEVTQDVMLELWRGAGRYRPERGAVMSWVLTIAHRRSVDRVRAVRAAGDRDRRVAAASYLPPYDEVVEQVELRAEQERVRRCLRGLTELQRRSITLAYYGGYSQAQIAELLDVPLGTVKTRTRDGLIRMRAGLTTDGGGAPGQPRRIPTVRARPLVGPMRERCEWSPRPSARRVEEQ